MSQDSTTRLRELAAKWRVEAINGTTSTAYEDGRVAEKLRCADELDALLARPAPPASAGGEWVVVPREPTPSMLHYVIGDTVSEGRAYYAAMLAAAPTPPATAGQEGA